MDLRDDLRAYIQKEIFKGRVPAAFDDDFDLIESGFVDSLSTMNLIMHLEQAHGVEFGINDIVPQNLKSVTALVGLLESRRG